MAVEATTKDTYVEVVVDTRSQSRYNCCVNRQRLHSIITGYVLFSYGGMDMAQGLGWNLYSGVPSTSQFCFSWFIGVIIGAILSATSLSRVPKFYFYTTAIVTQLIGALICVSAPYNYDAMVAARYMGGIGIGLITVAFIIHNSEVAPSDSRGKYCAFEQSGLGLGIAVQVIMNSMWNPALPIAMNQVHGIIGIVFVIVAIGVLILSAESPIFYMRLNDDVKASSCQWAVLGKNSTAQQFREVFGENKLYVEESECRSLGEEQSASGMPFIKMFFCRCLVAFTFSLPLTQTIIVSSTVWKGTMYSWPIIVWRVLRYLGTLIAIIFMDKLGRKIMSLLGLVCMGGVLLGMASLYSDSANITSTSEMAVLCRVSMTFQVFSGLFVACTPAYLGEAFPMRVKPFLIALIVCSEQLIHIIVIVTFNGTVIAFYQYYLAVGIILILCFILLMVTLPETRNMTLRQAGERFRRLYDIKPY